MAILGEDGMPETGGTGKTKQRRAEGEASETRALGNTVISIRVIATPAGGIEEQDRLERL